MDWFDDQSGQILPFLHMDPQTMQTPDNLIRIWKTTERPIRIFGRDITDDDKNLVSEVLDVFYHVTYGRRISLENTNPDSEFVHTASMIDEFFPMINKYSKGIRTQENKLHADLTWPNIKNNAPRGIEDTSNKYLIAWHVNEFFRYFNGIGSLSYSRGAIEEFYRYVRLAQSQANAQDRIRLLWFGMTTMLYARGPVPDVVKDAFGAYMSYFEHNLVHFDAELGASHTVPGSPEDTFSDVLGASARDFGMKYIP